MHRPNFADRSMPGLTRLLRQSEPDSSGIIPAWLVVGAVVLGCCLRLPIAVPQYATEGSLVLAGIVQYPPSSLMNYYFLGIWTSLHQFAALLLLVGVSQTIVDYMVSILPAGMLLGAMTMVIYGFCRRPIFSLAAGVICFSTLTVSSEFGSPDYPLLGAIWANSREHTFGIWGGVTATWALGALVGGRNVMAGFTAAVLVSIHPVIGLYISAILVVVMLVGHLLPSAFSTAGIGRGLIMGSAVTLVSLVFYLAARPPTPSSFNADDFATYLKVWDYHRSLKVDSGFVLAKARLPLLLAGGLALFLLASRGRSGPADAGALGLLGTTVGSTILFAAAHLGSPPQFFVNAIPGRLLNIHAYLSGAIILALMTWFVVRLLMMAVTELAVLYPEQLQRLIPPRRAIATALFGSFALMLAARSGTLESLEKFSTSMQLFVVTGHAPRFASDPNNETFWTEVKQAAARDLVLTSRDASFDAVTKGHLAIGFDPNGFDFVPYLPSTASAVRRFVEIGYGVSFSDPPTDLRARGSLPNGVERDYWAGLSVNQWRDEIGKNLGIAGIIAPREWKIALVPAVMGPQFNFYPIPR
jgi:hypothetical protein